MPSKSPKQARFMAACAHGAGYSSCPPDKVSTEFNQADKGTKLLSRAMKRADGGPSKNVQDLRRPYEVTHTILPGGIIEYHLPEPVSTVSPWQATVHYEPSELLGQSAKRFLDQEQAKSLENLKQAYPGFDFAPAEDGGWWARKTPPTPERNPKRKAEGGATDDNKRLAHYLDNLIANVTQIEDTTPFTQRYGNSPTFNHPMGFLNSPFVRQRAPGGMLDAPGLPYEPVGDVIPFIRKSKSPYEVGPTEMGPRGSYYGGSGYRVGSPEWNAEYEAKQGLKPGSLKPSNAGRGDVVQMPEKMLSDEEASKLIARTNSGSKYSPDSYDLHNISRIIRESKEGKYLTNRVNQGYLSQAEADQLGKWASNRGMMNERGRPTPEAYENSPNFGVNGRVPWMKDGRATPSTYEHLRQDWLNKSNDFKEYWAKMTNTEKDQFLMYNHDIIFPDSLYERAEGGGLFHDPTTSEEELPFTPIPKHIKGEEPVEVGNEKVNFTPYVEDTRGLDPYAPPMTARLARGQASQVSQTGRGSWMPEEKPSSGSGIDWNRLGRLAFDPTDPEVLMNVGLGLLPMGEAVGALARAREVPLRTIAKSFPDQFRSWNMAIRSDMPETLFGTKQGFKNTVGSPFKNPITEKLTYTPAPRPSMTQELRAIHRNALNKMPKRQPNVSAYSDAEKQRVMEAAMQARQNRLSDQLLEKGELDAATPGLVGHAVGGDVISSPSLPSANPPMDIGGAYEDYNNMLQKLRDLKSIDWEHMPERKMGPGNYAKGGFTTKPSAPPKQIGSGMTPAEKGMSIHTARMASGAGFLHSRVPGRTDQIGLNVRNGSYVIPADVVAGHGQGNSLAGAAKMDKLFKSGPYGTPGGRLPNVRPKSPPAAPRASFISAKRAQGGETHVPVMAAGGEYIVEPEAVARVGNGDPERGFRILDQFVLNSRKKDIKTLKGLKPPRKD